MDEIYGFLFVRPYNALAAFLADIIDWKFWHDWFHDTVIARTFRGLTHFLATIIDLEFIDAAAEGLAVLTSLLGRGLRKLQSGFVRNYALSVFVGVVVILGYLIFR